MLVGSTVMSDVCVLLNSVGCRDDCYRSFLGGACFHGVCGFVGDESLLSIVSAVLLFTVVWSELGRGASELPGGTHVEKVKRVKSKENFFSLSLRIA